MPVLTTVTNALTYDSFGGLLYQRNPIGSLDLTFSGRDASGFGFLNFRARTYDPRLGRFMQSDAIEPFGFVFASNNPSEFIDPLGLIEIPSYTAIATRVAAQSLPVYSRAFVVYQSGVFAAMEGYDRCKSTGGSLCEAKFIASVAVLGKLSLVKNLYSGIGVPGALFSIAVQWWLAEKGLPVNLLELLF
jgi:RHS repeat-associated protein